ARGPCALLATRPARDLYSMARAVLAEARDAASRAHLVLAAGRGARRHCRRVRGAVRTGPKSKVEGPRSGSAFFDFGLWTLDFELSLDLGSSSRPARQRA